VEFPRGGIVRGGVEGYCGFMRLMQMLRRIAGAVTRVSHKVARKLTPPGNRGSLDTSYRQPLMDPEHEMSAGTQIEKLNGGGGL